MQPDESVIMKHNRVQYRSYGYSQELVLTNQNIIWVKKGLFLGKIKKIQKYPLGQIKIFNGQVQAMINKSNLMRPSLEVYFLNSIEAFGFESRKEIEKWINNINFLVTGSFIEPETSSIAAVVKQAIKGKFGIETKNQGHQSIEKVVKKCTACGASVTGQSGQIIRCQYCDTNIQL